MPPSRQERRKAERDAAKRASVQAAAAGAAETGGAAAAAPPNANVNVYLGDWTTQSKNPEVWPRRLLLLATSSNVAYAGCTPRVNHTSAGSVSATPQHTVHPSDSVSSTLVSFR
jgi:hypothetical protein